MKNELQGDQQRIDSNKNHIETLKNSRKTR